MIHMVMHADGELHVPWRCGTKDPDLITAAGAGRNRAGPSLGADARHDTFM